MSAETLNLKRTAFIFAVAWTVAVVLGAGWHFLGLRERVLEGARIQAGHSFEKDLVYRRWVSSHGGVYVPVTEDTPPNPYLSNTGNRDITTDSGLNLTLINPAYMTRQVHELGLERYGLQGHITSLNPIRPENAADAWEAEALRAFERGEIEVVELAMIEDTEYLRLMRPMFTEASCLKCHAAQGYQVGDLRGGISVSVPMAPLWTPMYGRIPALTMGYGLIWLLGLGGIGIGAVRMRQHNTERDRAEEELRQYGHIFSTARDMVALIDQHYVYLAVNPAYLDAFGKARDEVIGHTMADVFGEEFFSTVIRPKTDRCLAGDRIRYQDWFEFPFSGRTYMDIACEPYLGSGTEVRGFVVAARDITEHKQAEEERLRLEVHLRQQQKLESIGTLAGGIAHEINNPITGIMNYAQLIDERLDAESPLRQFAVGIGRETERVASIVSNLLAFARLDKQSHSPARIEDIVNDTVSLIATIIRRDQITLEVDVSDDLPEIKCRSQQIQQVLMNLLTNARDALNERYPEHHPDKLMRVTARPFEKDDRPWVRVTVEDHGAGIQDEIRDRIFDPFFTTKDRTEGTGLGLSISHGIVQEHHGKLWVECEAGRHTRFHVDLLVDNGWTLNEASEASEE